MFYAEDSKVRARQLRNDAVVVLWCLAWALIGRFVYRSILVLREPGQRVQETAQNMGDTLERSGNRLPSPLRGPFESIGGSADSLSSAARAQVEAVETAATAIGWTVALVPILAALLVAYLLRRRWAKEANAAARLRNSPNFDELMARRALANQSLARIAKVSSDPYGDIERGNYHALAELEAADLGLELQRNDQASSPPS